MTAIRRKKANVLQKRHKINVHEQLQDCWDYFPRASAKSATDSALFEYVDLSRALSKATKRDRYIFFAHVLEERGFSELGAELSMGYKGVAAAYYRTVRKTREDMRGGTK